MGMTPGQAAEKEGRQGERQRGEGGSQRGKGGRERGREGREAGREEERDKKKIVRRHGGWKRGMDRGGEGSGPAPSCSITSEEQERTATRAVPMPSASLSPCSSKPPLPFLRVKHGLIPGRQLIGPWRQHSDSNTARTVHLIVCCLSYYVLLFLSMR